MKVRYGYWCWLDDGLLYANCTDACAAVALLPSSLISALPGRMDTTILPVTAAPAALLKLTRGEVTAIGWSPELLFVGGETFQAEGYVKPRFRSVPFETYVCSVLSAVVSGATAGCCDDELEDCAGGGVVL